MDEVKLYFAYGSNLYKEQMKVRCPKSKYLEKHYFDDHKLCFCWNGLSTNPNGVANIIKETGSKVPGVIYEISKSDEKRLDIYEEYPILYKKMYFNYYNNEIMTYIMVKKSTYKKPTEKYLNTIIKGYKDCKLDKKYLNKALRPSW